MSRQADILLGSNAWATGNENPKLNPMYGGQFGWATNPAEWYSAQAHIPRHLFPIVLETPLFFKYMPNPDYWITAWRVFWEKHVRKISGLKAGLVAEVAEHDFGGAGEKFQEFTNMTRERSELAVELVDKYGNVWQDYWEHVMLYGMMDPETKTPLTATLENDGPKDQLADWYSGTIAFIEPDATGRRAHRVWLGANIWPHSNGPVEGNMDKTTALSIKELSLDFSITAFYGHGTRALGQELMDGISKNWANPQLRKAFLKEINPDVQAIKKGYAESVTSVATEKVGNLI